MTLMNVFLARILVTLVLMAGVFPGLAVAETTAPAAEAEPPPTAVSTDFDSLVGLWVRPDGGYMVAIRGVEANGKLDAVYANPQQLPFASAQAENTADGIEVHLELQAGGYNGSTYTLAYDPERDILRGVYFQAVAQQSYEVYFQRAR
jgi:hypothetical protein